MPKYNHIPEGDPYYQNMKRSALLQAIEVSQYEHDTTIGPRKVNSVPHSSDVTFPVKTTQPQRTTVTVEACHNEPLIESEHNSLSFRKLMHEYKVQNKEATDIVLKGMISNVIAELHEIQTECRHKQELEYESMIQKERDREMEILQELAAGDNLAELEQKKLDNEHMYAEKQLESARLFKKLDKNYFKLSSLRGDVINILSANKTILSKNCQRYESVITDIFSSIDNVIEKFKSGNVRSDDIQKTETLLTQMVDLKTAVLQEISDIEITKKALEEAAKISESVQSKKIEDTTGNDNLSHEKQKSVAIAPEKVKYFSKQSHNLYIEAKEYLENYETTYKNLLQDNSLKKFRFELQKAVNTPLNSISSVSGSHLKDKFDKLFQLLSGERVRLQNDYISANQHPEGKAFCMNLLAKKIVQQGDLTVASNPESAFPIASVTIALCAKFPQLIKLLKAHFYKDCPYLIPMLVPQCEGVSDEEFYKARGYRYNEDGSVEKQDKFIKRMSGIFRLHAAMWVVTMPRSINAPHPQSLSHAWRWLAAFTNLEPEMEISATLLFDFLTVCGSECFKYYKRQFAKVLQLLMTDYYDKMQKIDEGGPKTRLGVFMQKIAKDGHIPPPSGSLSRNIW